MTKNNINQKVSEFVNMYNRTPQISNFEMMPFEDELTNNLTI